ncbi:MAG TPA: glycosyl hydrolase 53 family protein [Ginsengibacter sp.]|nr:glycosyl hydrolase 53 family protein [Ginsengibacter sp.]
MYPFGFRQCLSLFIALTLFGLSCKKGQKPDSQPPAVAVKGADVSWITEMENQGKKFFNTSGTEEDLFAILKGVGMNAIRLRVWVAPPDGYNAPTDVLAKAKRAASAGMDVLIDFHYSDSWADPGQQTIPASWTDHSLAALGEQVAAHTVAVLSQLKQAGVSVRWVQVGNETNDGMLWPTGKASVDMASFASLIDSGYSAVKSVYPQAKVIVHLSNGFDNSLFRWMFDGLKANGTRWDVIGMSMYPAVHNWKLLNEQALANMNDMVTRYDKEVMMVECGMPWDQPQGTRQFLTDLIQKVQSVEKGRGIGVFYWEPEAYGNWKGYTLGAFDNSGKPTVALDAFR